MRALLLLLLVAACSDPKAAPPDCTSNDECTDNVFCNGEEVCDPYIGECVAGIPIACADGTACTVDACDETAAACTATPDDDRCGPREACDPTAGCTSHAECHALDSSYGAPLTITAASAIADTTFQLTLDTAALIAASKLQADCDDLRITDASGAPLAFWVEGCNTTTTILTVRITGLAAGATALYLNYGNATAGSARNFNGTYLAFYDFEDNDLVGWTSGTVNYQQNLDGPTTVSTSTLVKKSGSYALQLRADASCMSSPFDGAGSYVERTITSTGSYCVDYDWRADITGFQFSTTANMNARVVIGGTPTVAGVTSCAGANCTATGTWTHGTTTPMMGDLRLQGSASDCADGNVYFDNVRVRSCVADADLTVTAGVERDCSTL